MQNISFNYRTGKLERVSSNGIHHNKLPFAALFKHKKKKKRNSTQGLRRVSDVFLLKEEEEDDQEEEKKEKIEENHSNSNGTLLQTPTKKKKKKKKRNKRLELQSNLQSSKKPRLEEQQTKASPQPIPEGMSSQNPIDILDDDSGPESSDSKVLCYPPGEKNAITVTIKDLDCLKPREFLNDTIIEFYLKYIERVLIPKGHANKFYFFNSFFYGKLRQGYSQVQNWTKHIDIFSKNYLIIPINESAHWLLAIICLDTASHKVPIGQRLLIFDSLGGKNEGVAHRLREYLECEWRDKKKTQKKFTDQVLPCFAPMVPQQQNYCDCGVFLLHYAELFCKKPPPKIKVLNGKWFPLKKISDKRQKIESLIHQLQQKVSSSDSSEEDTHNNSTEMKSPQKNSLSSLNNTTDHPPDTPLQNNTDKFPVSTPEKSPQKDSLSSLNNILDHPPDTLLQNHSDNSPFSTPQSVTPSKRKRRRRRRSHSLSASPATPITPKKCDFSDSE